MCPTSDNGLIPAKSLTSQLESKALTYHIYGPLANGKNKQLTNAFPFNPRLLVGNREPIHTLVMTLMSANWHVRIASTIIIGRHVGRVGYGR